ncbi:hypothetical protein AAMO2058_000767500, partial [Amorphochlora amoebiformis]
MMLRQWRPLNHLRSVDWSVEREGGQIGGRLIRLVENMSVPNQPRCHRLEIVRWLRTLAVGSINGWPTRVPHIVDARLYHKTFYDFRLEIGYGRAWTGSKTRACTTWRLGGWWGMVLRLRLFVPQLRFKILMMSAPKMHRFCHR